MGLLPELHSGWFPRSFRWFETAAGFCFTALQTTIADTLPLRPGFMLAGERNATWGAFRSDGMRAMLVARQVVRFYWQVKCPVCNVKCICAGSRRGDAQGGRQPLLWGEPPAGCVPAFCAGAKRACGVGGTRPPRLSPGGGNGKGGVPIPCRRLFSSRSLPMVPKWPCSAAHLGLRRGQAAGRPARHFVRAKPHRHRSIHALVHADVAARQCVPPAALFDL